MLLRQSLGPSDAVADDDRMPIVIHLLVMAATRMDDDLVCRIGFFFVIQDLVVQCKGECNFYDICFGKSNSEDTVNIDSDYGWFRASVNMMVATCVDDSHLMPNENTYEELTGMEPATDASAAPVSWNRCKCT